MLWLLIGAVPIATRSNGRRKQDQGRASKQFTSHGTSRRRATTAIAEPSHELDSHVD